MIGDDLTSYNERLRRLLVDAANGRRKARADRGAGAERRDRSCGHDGGDRDRHLVRLLFLRFPAERSHWLKPSMSPSSRRQRGAGERAERLWARAMTASIVVLLGVIVSHQRALGPASALARGDDRLDFPAQGRRILRGQSGHDRSRPTVRPSCGWWRSSTRSFRAASLVPAGVPVTMRLASADVVHGFLIQGTNVNAMVVPGYVTTVRTTFAESGERLMPCHEFCGVGHQAMWAHVRIVDAKHFRPKTPKRRL